MSTRKKYTNFKVVCGNKFSYHFPREIIEH